MNASNLEMFGLGLGVVVIAYLTGYAIAFIRNH